MGMGTSGRSGWRQGLLALSSARGLATSSHPLTPPQYTWGFQSLKTLPHQQASTAAFLEPLPRGGLETKGFWLTWPKACIPAQRATRKNSRGDASRL